MDSDKLKELFKDKRVLIGAAVLGAIAGLYVLSQRGGMSAGGGGTGDSPLPSPQPDAGGGGAATDWGAQIAELAAGQTSFQSQITGMFSALTDSLNQAISQVRGENQSALQSVIDQVNSQLASGQNTPGQTVPDFAGFQSQLTEALGAFQQQAQRVNSTGTILKNPTMGGRQQILPSIPQDILSKVNRQISQSAPRVTGQKVSGSRSIPQRVSTFVDPRRGGGSSFTGSSGNKGVPFNIGSTYNRFMQSVNRASGTVARRAATPVRSVPKPLPTIRKGGNAILKGR